LGYWNLIGQREEISPRRHGEEKKEEEEEVNRRVRRGLGGKKRKRFHHGGTEKRRREKRKRLTAEFAEGAEAKRWILVIFPQRHLCPLWLIFPGC
jgi:hypothetical protein